MKKKLLNLVIWLVFLVGISLLLYPSISDYWNSYHQTKAIATYQKELKHLDTKDYQQILSQAKAYNKKLLQEPDRFIKNVERMKEYHSQLKIGNSSVMAYLEIPAIRVSLPVYHGVDEETLANGVGHIYGSSLPVGGASTHSVLSGHRGLPSAILLSDLDQLEKGDIFIIHVLNKVLTYQVDQIKTVLPPEFDDLNIVPNQDYCTLVTCTPYGINTHRLLVRGHRVANIYGADLSFVTAEAKKVSIYWAALAYGLPLLCMSLFLIFKYDQWQSSRNAKKIQLLLKNKENQKDSI